MFALALLFILIVCIWWVRAYKLLKQRKSYPLLMQRIRDHVTEGDLDNARQLCKAENTPGARILEAGLKKTGKTMSCVREALSESSQSEERNLDKGLPWLRFIAVISPLLGLGGTLVGITDRLRDLAQSASPVDSAVICGEIAPTLVTTVAGLGVGIFSLLAFTCLSSSVASSIRSLDEVALDFTDLLEGPSA